MSFDLDFPGGAVANCETSFGKGMNELHVACKNGWYNLTPFQSYSGIRGTTSDKRELNATVPNQQAKQMDDDALAIIQNKSVLVPGEEGLKDIRVVEAAYRSVKAKASVKIS
jgi:glucose-fructose oxidoreductase